MSTQNPNADDIDKAHWAGCAPGRAPFEPVYPNQKNSGKPNDPEVGPTNTLKKQE